MCCCLVRQHYKKWWAKKRQQFGANATVCVCVCACLIFASVLFLELQDPPPPSAPALRCLVSGLGLSSNSKSLRHGFGASSWISCTLSCRIARLWSCAYATTGAKCASFSGFHDVRDICCISDQQSSLLCRFETESQVGPSLAVELSCS